MFNGAHLHRASEYMVSWYTGHSATEYRCRVHIIINAIITVWHTPANLSNASSFFTLIVINILKCQRHTEPGVRTLLYHLSWFFVIYWYKLPPAISSCSPPTCSLVFLFRGRSSHSTVPLAPHPSKHIFNKELYLLFLYYQTTVVFWLWSHWDIFSSFPVFIYFCAFYSQPWYYSSL